MFRYYEARRAKLRDEGEDESSKKVRQTPVVDYCAAEYRVERC